MSFIKRFIDVIRANINELIDKAEHPVKMLEQLIRDMEDNYKKAKVKTAQVMGELRVIENRLAKAKDLEKAWKDRAMLALREDREDLAKEALLKRRSASQDQAFLQQELIKQKEAAETLQKGLKALELKIEEAKKKRAILATKVRRAQVQKELREVITGIDDEGLIKAFDDMEERIELMEAQGDALKELEGISAEQQLQALEADHELQKELKALKAEMGILPSEDMDEPEKD